MASNNNNAGGRQNPESPSYIQAKDQNAVRIRQSLAEPITEIIGGPYGRGVYREEVALSYGLNQYEHRLGRKYRGFAVINIIASQVVSFFATHSTDQIIGTGSETVVSYDTTTINNGSAYSTSTNRFTAPTKGLYAVSANLYWQNPSAGSCEMKIQKNGTIVRYGNIAALAAGSYTGQVATAELQLEQNDYVQISVWQNTGANATLYNNAGANRALRTFSGALIGSPYPYADSTSTIDPKLYIPLVCERPCTASIWSW